MLYKQSSAIKGEWVRASELTNGVLIKLVSETKPMTSEFGEQDVAQCKIKGFEGVKNIRINKTSIGGLIQAFGEDSNNWIDKPLTANIEKAIVGGKRVTILYLVPAGFELKEDISGYMGIVKIGAEIPIINDSDEDPGPNTPF